MYLCAQNITLIIFTNKDEEVYYRLGSNREQKIKL